MLNSKNIIKIQIWIIGLTLLSIGCAYSQQQKQIPITIPDDTRMILFVDKNAKISAVVDVNGIPAPTCQLCTVALQKIYGQNCSGAPAQARLCKAGTIATIRVTNDDIIIYQSYHNPTCITEYAAGQATEICWDE